MSKDLLAENVSLRDQLKNLLEQAHRNQQIMRRHQMLDLKFIGANSFTELIGSVFHAFSETSELDTVVLVLLDPDYSIRRILADLHIHLHEFPNLIFLQNESELGDLQIRLHKPVLGRYSEQLFGSVFPEPLPTPASVAVVPLIRNHTLIGCLALGSGQDGRFDGNIATDFLEHQASIVAICIENVINKELLKHIGWTDALTRVNNRRYIEHRLLEEIGRSKRHGYALSCMYIDIDHFKQINDTIGHQGGDEVLREVAGRIKAELRLSDALGRFGGEEFVALLIDAEPVDSSNVAERIRASIAEQPLTLSSGQTLFATVSIGIATLEESDRGNTAEAIAQKLIVSADQALYRAKSGGRNKVVIFDQRQV
ncbi:MAG: diguanylate cyclase [Burkholderiales bacterium RIFCSPLOWO2_02_FULL_57_36]|nr:MAG: diguanylate cyclase [Burkholderiales bacterium RIFCSPLOWO2_02_FULL_57_36]